MELRVTGLGFAPYFIPKADGEFDGFELDALRAVAENLQATIKVEQASDWLGVKFDENGSMIFDETGNPVFVGCLAEVFYQRATFAVGEIYLLEDYFAMVDVMIQSHQYVYFRAGKPEVSLLSLSLIHFIT